MTRQQGTGSETPPAPAPTPGGVERGPTASPIFEAAEKMSPAAALPAAWKQVLEGDDAAAIEALIEKLSAASKRKKLDTFVPFPKQVEFIEAGRDNRVRLLLAGNRAGKTVTATYEVACHLTGRYPADWKGRKFDGPIEAWVAGVNAQETRNVIQKELIGPYQRRDEWGTGFLPASDLDLANVSMQSGITAAIDTISVKHVSGGWSTLSFMSYAQGREKFQGGAIHVVLLDEECPQDIYEECVTRTLTTRGCVMLTFTPLKGFTTLVKSFIDPTTRPGALIRATMDDNLSLTKEDIEDYLKTVPDIAREARRLGVPFMGSGRIFTTLEETIRVEPFAIPPHWPQLGAVDLGIDHPFAAVKIAIDPDSDVVYVTQAHRVKGQTTLEHAAFLKGWGKDLPFVYPHDALQRDRGSGDTFAKRYRDHGLNMVARAAFPDGSNSVEAGIQEMIERFMTSRLRIFSNLNDVFEEYRIYHRKDGVIEKTGDDLLCAIRYALMGRRYARTRTAMQDRDKPLRRKLPGIV